MRCLQVIQNYVHQNRHSWRFKQDSEVVPDGTSWAQSVIFWFQYRCTIREAVTAVQASR